MSAPRRHTVLLVPDDRPIVVSVPAMPGCVSVGRTRSEALANVQDAMRGWLDVEASQGRAPLAETPALMAAAVAQAIEIIEEMRQAGETSPGQGYELELTTVELPQLARA
ncbi:MAG TPA: type II toxin-antitoxin system HicB family antitoxin [Chloroflexota bacterium]|nr:type II toxin-antitoxin system HicB family antitoxin [Chloroflexota bacterium]